jgi:hypothetical protein
MRLFVRTVQVPDPRRGGMSDLKTIIVERIRELPDVQDSRFAEGLFTYIQMRRAQHITGNSVEDVVENVAKVAEQVVDELRAHLDFVPYSWEWVDSQMGNRLPI